MQRKCPSWDRWTPSGDSGFSTAFLVSLPDGNTARVSTDSLVLAQTIVDTACVQTRAHEAGKLS
ncbi:MAG: hypothetical protein ABJN14_03205 [Paracoccaceae bacterium]